MGETTDPDFSPVNVALINATKEVVLEIMGKQSSPGQFYNDPGAREKLAVLIKDVYAAFEDGYRRADRE